jgi:GNAT superfamily N-acetyltransferase
MPDIVLRNALAEDVDLLFEWVNHPSSIEAKLKTDEPIAYVVHRKWLTAILADPNAKLWIAVVSTGSVGQVRVESEKPGLKVDIFVAHEFRGRGLGQKMLQTLAVECEKLWPGQPLIAHVLHENQASMALFTQAGYELVDSADTHSVLRRNAF